MYKLLLSAILLTTTLLSVNGESFQFCVNESINYTKFGENVQVTSLGYPEQYDISRSCSLALFLPTDMPAVLHITQYIPTTAVCSVPYAIADSRSSLLPNQYKSCSQKDDLNIYTNVVPILSDESPSAILILSTAGLADGFNLNLTVTRDKAANTTTTASSTVKSVAKTTSTSVSMSSSNPIPSTVSRSQLSTSMTQSTIFTSQPATLTSQSTTFTSQSTPFTSQPVTFTSQPTTLTSQSTTFTSQSTTFTSQPTTLTSQPATLISQPTTSTSQPTTFTSQSTTFTSQSTTFTSQPTTFTSQLTNNSEPTINETQSQTNFTTSTSALPLGAWIAIGAGSGTFLLIVVAIILGCILGRRNNDRLSSKKRTNMNAYEESDQNDENPNRFTSGRVGGHPFNQYSDIDLNFYAHENLPEEMVESVEPAPDSTNHYFTIEEPGCSASIQTNPCHSQSTTQSHAQSQDAVRYADNDQMPMSTFSGGATSATGMGPNPYSDADEPEVSTNLRFPAKTRPDPANQYSDIDLSPAPANEMEDTNHYWEIEHTNDGQMNTSSEPTTERDVSVEPVERPAAEREQTAPVYSRIQKTPTMIDNSLYEAN